MTTVVENFDLGPNLLQLENYLNHLKTEKEILSFVITLTNISKLAQSLILLTRHSSNLFSNIPKDIFKYITSYLPNSYIFITKCVCKNWLANLHGLKSVNTYISKELEKSLFLAIEPKFSFILDGKIVITNSSGSCYVYDPITDEFLVGEFFDKCCNAKCLATNGKDLCIQKDEGLLFLKYDGDEILHSINLTNSKDIGFYKNSISILYSNVIHFIDTKMGYLCNSWKFKFSKFKKIVPYENEMFLIEDYNIKVFSNDGDFLRSWGKLGNDPGDFKNISCVRIYDNIVHVIDNDNHRLQSFTLNGDLIILYDYNPKKNIHDIICIDDFICLINIKNYSITKLNRKNMNKYYHF
jgi:hypothetical protein